MELRRMNTSQNSESFSVPITWNYIMAVIMMVACLTAVFENLVLLIILHKFNVFCKQFCKMLGSLAVADFLTGLVLAPMYAVSFFFAAQNIDHFSFDLSHTIIDTILIPASAFHMTFIALYRCARLIKLNSFNMSWRAMYAFLLVCWILPVIIIILVILLVDEGNRDTFWLVFFTVGIVIVLLVLFSNVGIIVALAINRYHSTNQVAVEAERKTGKTILIIVTLFSLMQFPYVVCLGIYACRRPLGMWVQYLDDLTNVLAVLNSSVNPLIYLVRNKQIRQRAKELFGFQKGATPSTPKTPEAPPPTSTNPHELKERFAHQNLGFVEEITESKGVSA